MLVTKHLCISLEGKVRSIDDGLVRSSVVRLRLLSDINTIYLLENLVLRKSIRKVVIVVLVRPFDYWSIGNP